MKDKKNGLTLIEVVITLAVASILGTMIFQMFSSVYATDAKINEMADYQTNAQIIMLNIKNELKYANSVVIETDAPARIASGTRYIYVSSGTPQLNKGISLSNAVSITQLRPGFTATLDFKKSSEKSIGVIVSIKNNGTEVYSLDTDVYLNNMTTNSISGLVQGSVISYTLPSSIANIATLNYNGNGNTEGTIPKDTNSPYISNAAVTVLGNTGSLAKSGYAFMNWNTAADGSGISYNSGDTFIINADTTLYAQWILGPYFVSYNGNGSTGGSIPTDSNTYYHGSSVSVMSNTGGLVKARHIFSGWNTKSDGTGISLNSGAVLTIYETTVLYAKWTEINIPSISVKNKKITVSGVQTGAEIILYKDGIEVNKIQLSGNGTSHTFNNQQPGTYTATQKVSGNESEHSSTVTIK